MGFNAQGQNKAVDGLAAAITHVGLLDATGAEITGGAPAYARKAVTWAAAVSGVRQANADVTFDVPGVTVAQLAFYSAVTAGIQYGAVPIGGYEVEAATVAAATDAFLDYGHGLPVGARVVVTTVHTNGLPGGLASNTLYYVVGITTDTFQVSLTNGGAPVNITTNGKVLYQRGAPVTFGAQSTMPYLAANLALDARLAA